MHRDDAGRSTATPPGDVSPGSADVLRALLGVQSVVVSVDGVVLAGAADGLEPPSTAALMVAVTLSTAIARRRAGRCLAADPHRRTLKETL